MGKRRTQLRAAQRASGKTKPTSDLIYGKVELPTDRTTIIKTDNFRSIPTHDPNFEVIEFKPHFRTIIVGTGRARRAMQIPLPYLQATRFYGKAICPDSNRGGPIYTSSLYLSVSNEPIVDLSTPVYTLPSEGAYRGLQCCITFLKLPRDASLQQLFAEFWQSPFISDIFMYRAVVGAGASFPFDKYSTWATYDLDSILKIKWNENPIHQTFYGNHPAYLSGIPRDFKLQGVPH